MRLQLTVTSQKDKEKIRQIVNIEIEIQSSYSPQNLWMIYAGSSNCHNEKNYQFFSYKKIIGISNIKFSYDGIIFYGKIASVATGDYGGIEDWIIDTEGENQNYHFDTSQSPSYYNDGSTFIVDLDEVKTYPGFENLSTVQCFANLVKLKDRDISYDIRTDRYIVDGNHLETIGPNEYYTINPEDV